MNGDHTNNMPSGWIDSHTHVHDKRVGVEQFEIARRGGVVGFVNVGAGLDHSRGAIGIARGRRDVWATAGIHPHTSDTDSVDELERLISDQAAVGEPVVAVGECGLDYYRDLSPRPVQLDSFQAQIELAQKLDLALIVHSRDAWDDCFACFERVGVPERTVIHCFSGGINEAKKLVSLGCILSFSGNITFGRSNDIREAAVWTPGDSMLVETDAPYLTPVPNRGKPNSPAYVTIVGAALAEMRGQAVEEVCEQTAANTRRVFQLGD